ncbi:MAG: response regulator [bacterium]
MNPKKKILLVEDDVSFISLFHTLLVRAGFEVFEAHDGQEAETVAVRVNPDMLIIDLGIPKKDGLAVCREIRKTEWGKKTAIIILTGKPLDDDILKTVMQVEPAYYCVKGDLSSDDFISKVRSVFEEQVG